MKWVLALPVTFLAVIIIAIVVLWAGSNRFLDKEFEHTKSTNKLLEFVENSSGMVSIPTAEGFSFRARIAGFDNPQSKGNLILLHGFPETSAMWISLIKAASTAGYRVVAFDQRGYSPGARPAKVEDYNIEYLARDVLDIADAVGFDDFHLVGHDWGAVIGWYFANENEDRIISLSALSVPHPKAFFEALWNDTDQQRRSRYIRFFMIPWVPERVFAFQDFKLLKNLYTDHGNSTINEYLKVFSEPQALSGALNWYRASFRHDKMEIENFPITIPVLFVWGNEDPAIGRAAVIAQRPMMPQDYTEVELKSGHWLMESPERINIIVLQHLEKVK